ncbi:MAG: uroporphyrinogen decarboxylase family protein [Lentisphaeria bacterium]|nr:uroporphyrinogen decarboxylase family protein [Lentisphaeria bacterium]
MTLKWTTHADLRISRSPSLDRDEYLDWMTFKGGSRIPFIEIFGPLIGLKEEWEEQGASPQELDFSAFTFREPRTAGVAVNTGRMGGPSELLEETADYALYRDDIGRVMRLSKGVATIPLPETWPVRTMDDWLKIKPKYLFDASRFRENWAAKARQARKEGAVIQVSMPGGFDEPRQLMGEEALCYAYYECPELIHDMLDTMGRTVCHVLDRVTQEVPVDVLFVHEDMAGKSGSLIGPREILTFIKPYYRRVWDLVSGRGARLFDQDSDGNMNSVIPAFLECGINCMHPMEPAAGMDIVATRKKYGETLAFKGGLDKFILRKTRADIDAELERKIPLMMATRGCMLGLDHRIPNGSSLENYRYYIRKVWEYIG